MNVLVLVLVLVLMFCSVPNAAAACRGRVQVAGQDQATDRVRQHLPARDQYRAVRGGALRVDLLRPLAVRLEHSRVLRGGTCFSDCDGGGGGGRGGGGRGRGRGGRGASFSFGPCALLPLSSALSCVFRIHQQANVDTTGGYQRCRGHHPVAHHQDLVGGQGQAGPVHRVVLEQGRRAHQGLCSYPRLLRLHLSLFPVFV